MEITKDIRYVGVNDHDVDLFEGQYVVPNGMAYNSYVILDEKIAVMDTVDARFGQEWRPPSGLPDRTAHGAGSFRQYRQIYGALSGYHRRVQRKGLCHDEAVLWHGIC